MRTVHVNSPEMRRVLKDVGGELATAGGGDEDTVFAEKAPRTSRSSGKVRHGCGGASGATSTRARRRRWSDAAVFEAAAAEHARRRKGITGERERKGAIEQVH